MKVNYKCQVMKDMKRCVVNLTIDLYGSSLRKRVAGLF
jgi:hypothetical protein